MNKEYSKTNNVVFCSNDRYLVFTNELGPIRNIYIGQTFPLQGYSVRGRLFKDQMCLEYVEDGEGELIYYKNKEPISKGDIIFVKEGVKYSIIQNDSKPLKKTWIILNSNYLSVMLEDFQISTGVYRLNGKINFEVFKSITKETETASIVRIINEKVNQCVFNVNTKEIHFDSTAFLIKQKLDDLVFEKYSMKELSKEFYISVSTFNRIFKKEYNVSPCDYLLTKKIDVAKTMLQKNNLTIKHIAYKLCFTNEYYFAYYFKKKTGKTPSEYKKTTNF